MGLVETEAIILRTYRLAEADKIVVCLTEKAGLVRGVARGARRLKSKFGAALEPFTLAHLTYFEKEGRELVTIKHLEIRRSFFDLAREAEAFETLEYFGELAVEFMPPHLADERLFRMVRASVEALARNPLKLSAAVSAYFELWMLRLAGFLPELETCGGCGRALKGAGVPVQMTAEGVLRCGPCAPAGGGVRLRSEAYAQLCAMRAQGPERWAQDYSVLPTESRQQLRGVTRRLVERALEREPRGGRPTRLHNPAGTYSNASDNG